MASKTYYYEGGPLDGQEATFDPRLLPQEVIFRQKDYDVHYWLVEGRYLYRGVRDWPGGRRPESLSAKKKPRRVGPGLLLSDEALPPGGARGATSS